MVATAIAAGVITTFVSRIITNVAPQPIKRMAPALFYGGPSLLNEADRAFEGAKEELLEKYKHHSGVELFLSPEKTMKGGVLDPLFRNIFLHEKLVSKDIDRNFALCLNTTHQRLTSANKQVVDDIIETTRRHLLSNATTSPFVIEAGIREIKNSLSAIYELTKRREASLNRYSSVASASDKVDDFSRAYHQNLRDYIESLFVRGLEMVTKRDQIHHHLQDAYVPVHAKALQSQDDSDVSPRLSAFDVIREARWTIMRGPAGCGKTTLMQWIIWNSDPFSENKTGDDAVPFFPIYVPLRRLESAGTHQFSIETVIHDTLPTPQLKANIPPNWLRTLVGRNIDVILLIDGVDEVPEENRSKVWRFIRTICDQFPAVRILITSRHVSSVHLADGSYSPSIFLDQEQFLAAKRLWDRPNGFFEFAITPLENGDLIDLIDKWYEGVDPSFLVRADQESIRFYPDSLKESLFDERNRAVLDLARTPLLCSLICMVFLLQKGRLPRDKRQLYDLSTTLLVETRDEARGLRTPDAFKGFNLERRLSMLRHLAIIMQEGS